MKIFCLYHNKKLICVTDSARKLENYLIQKKGNNIVIKTKENSIIYCDFIIYEFKGFMMRADEIKHCVSEILRRVDMYYSMISGLEYLLDIKEDKDLRKALNVIKKNRRLFVGNEVFEKIVKDTACTDLETMQAVGRLDREFSKIVNYAR